MKKILSLILAFVAIATAARAQTKFGLEVGGVQVTSANFSNITGGDIKSGTVTYHPTNKKLTLRDVTIIRQAGSGRRGIYNEKIGDLTIVFEGTNRITSDHSCALRCDAPTTLILSENSKTTFREKYSEAFYLTNGTVGRLVIQGSDTGTGELILEAPNEYAIEGEKGTETIRFTKAPIVTLNSAKSSLVNLGAVIFDRSASGKTSVTLAAGSGSQTVKDVQNWGTVGYNHIETPIGATFDTSKKTIVLNGEAVTGKVVVCEDVIPLDNNTKIPDANFRAYLRENFAGGKNYLTHAEAQKVTSISVSEKKIANLKGIEFFTALTYLDCENNQLTSLDVSKNTALKTLYCGKNQLTLLNVSGCTALTTLACYGNQLTSLNVSKNTALKWLQCYRNQLTALNVSNNTALTELTCYSNQIKGGNMLALVNSLPKVTSGKFYVINTNDSNEGNVITKSQVAIAKENNWKVYDYNGGSAVEYEGSDPIPYKLELTQGTNIVTSLSDYAVIRLATEKTDVFTVEEGESSVVLKSKKTGKTLMTAYEVAFLVPDDVTSADNIEFDITAADHALLKSWFTEDPLEGYDKVTLSFVALTTEDLIISFPKKVNTPEEFNIDALTIEMALSALIFWEKLQSFKDDDTGDLVIATMSGKDLFQVGEGNVITVFDDVTSADNIVYTITDKNREDLKKETGYPFDLFANYKTIQIKFEFGTTGIGASLNDNGKMTNDSWYTIDGKKLQGEPTKKGVYIIKGKKVKK